MNTLNRLGAVNAEVLCLYISSAEAILIFVFPNSYIWIHIYLTDVLERYMVDVFFSGLVRRKNETELAKNCQPIFH
eukprot:snap_masked-scaffold_95-processed-gene-0.10-mRNA-1 protein AED:1.00 eAED:1.00 QI:0/-1/0/0/-1/1/1/0/75